MSTASALALVVVLALSSLGCSNMPFGANVRTAKTIATEPSDVTIHLTVEDSGEPVDYLSASNFTIYENDVLLDSEEIGLRLLSREEHATGHTVVLLDLSGPPSPQELEKVARGTAHFVEMVSTTQPVTVLAFDGSPRPREVARFARVKTSTKRPVPDLRPFLSGDGSRDLNGNLLAATQGLNSLLTAGGGRVGYGTLVTLVRGSDLAGRKSEKEVRYELSNSSFAFYSLSPEDEKVEATNLLGTSGRETYDSWETLPMRFQDLGMKVRAAWQSHYVVSYCTPGRAGVRDVRVKVTYESAQGSHRSASTTSEFDATGFSGGCIPKSAGAGTLEPAASEPLAEEMPAAAPGEAASGPKSPTSGTPKVNPGPTTADPPAEEDAPIVAPPSSGKYE